MTYILKTDIGAIRGEIYLDLEKRLIEKVVLFSNSDRTGNCMILRDINEVADVGSVLEDLGRQLDEVLEKQNKNEMP